MTGATYDQAIGDFDHARLAALPAYARLRQALSDLGNEVPKAGGMEFGDWLAAVRDMAATAAFGDMCRECGTLAWPNSGVRNGDFIRGSYRCSQGHEWTCSYNVDLPRLIN